MGLLDELLMAETKKRNLMMQGTSPRVGGQLTQMVARPSQSPLREQFPTFYGALGGLLGMEPDSMEGSILDPNTAAVRQGASYGYPAGLALQALPMAAPASRGAKAVGKFVAPKAGQLAENYMQSMGMMPGIIERSNPNTVWYRGQTGAKSAENPFDSTIRGTPSLADSPAVASEYAMNPNAAGNYGLLGAGEDVSGAVVQPYTTSGKVFNINEYQGGFGTETGITQENLKKIAKELGVDPSKLTDELMENFSQKWGKGKNAYWDTTERGSKSKNKIIPAWVVAENQTLIDAAKKKGLDSIQFKGTLSDANAYDPLLPWSEKVTHQELRPLNREAIKSTFESPRTNNLAPQQAALDLAQQNAAKAGQSLDAYPRSLQQGYEHDWYHGSTGDIKSFNPSLLGEATGAASAKKGFFFARDPQNPPKSMLTKTTDQASIDMLKRLGKTDEEIAALNAVSMQGHGAETASGYAQIGGSREYRDATRKASAAEKRGDWDEYEKQAQIAEDSEIKRMNYAQDLTAKYGDRRDEMLSSINESIYSKKLGQAEAEALDAKVKELMPYGWYNKYDNKQFDNLKNEITKLVGKDAAAPALKEIDRFKSVKNERALIDKTQQGGNVMPVALRYQKPLMYDFEGKAYREQTYSDLIDQALAGGNDALILKNTFDPGGGPAKLVDVGVVFSPDQIRSRFAAFDPLRKTAAIATAAGVAAPDLLAADLNEEELRKQMQSYGLLY